MPEKYRPISELVESALTEDNKIDHEKLLNSLPLPRIPENGKQSVRLPETFAPNKLSSIYRSAYSPEHLVDRIAPDIHSLHDHFENAVELHPDFDCLGTRFFNKSSGEYDADYTFETYKQVQRRRNYLGSGIKKLVGRPKGESYVVSIFSPNRAEWVISSLAIQAFGLISTALYDTLGPNTSKYILDLTESPLLITTYSKLVSIIDLKKQGLAHLKYLICMDDLNFNEDLGLITLASDAGLKLLDFKQLERIGELNQQELEKPNDTFCISFTSGTTGNPKGVLVSQRMGIASQVFALGHIDKPNKFFKPDVETQIRYFCFLPLAHIYELMDIYLAIGANYKVYFPYDPSPLKILDHLKLIKPHYVTLVPRVYSKFESALKQNLSQSFVGRQIISRLVEKKQRDQSESVILDRLVFSKIRSKLGFDSIDFCGSGSAPISNETVQFLRAALNVGFKQGYGLTETFAGVSMSQTNENEVTSGPICVTTEMRLKDVPEMNYVTTDANGEELEEPQGELLLRGPQVFEGYYKNKKATEESFEDGNWFKTGDIAKIDKFGRILIIDRVKNFFKLAQGEYVTPERIENIYLSSCSSILSQCFIHGDSLKTYLVGILGVDALSIRRFLKEIGLSHVDFDSLNDQVLIDKVNNDPKIKKYLLNLLNTFIKKDGLQGFEKLHNFKVKIDPLRVEDEIVTPTFKIKRINATKFFKKDLEELYLEGSLMKNSNL